MSQYTDNTAGTTLSTGTDDYVVTGDLDTFVPVADGLTDGAEYTAKVQFADAADGADYELVVGTWDLGAGTFSRDTILKSSNNNLIVDWAAGTKRMDIVASSQMLGDMELMNDGATKKYLTVAERTNIANSKTKTDLISITQAVDLDVMEATLNAVTSGLQYRGTWDASVGTFPGGGTAQIGDFYFCTVPGIVGGQTFIAGDSCVALINNASISTYAGNWARQESTAAVASVNGQVGAVILRLAVERFSYKLDSTTPIFLVLTGQSNALGDDATGTDFNFNANVFSYQITTPVVSPTPPAMPAPADFSWQNVGSDAGAYPLTAYLPVADTSSGAPYVGYRRGGYGNIGMALADRLQRETGRDVYLLSVTLGASNLSRWQSGASGYCRIVLESFVPYVLANTPALADVTTPDIIVWGQGENNAGDAALTYKDAWIGVRNASDGLWSDLSLTSWYLMEFTPWALVNFGSYWEGTKAVNRYTDDKVQLVSAAGLPDGGTIHFTGGGLNDYGYQRMGDAVFGINPSKNLFSMQLELDRAPILGGNATFTGRTITGGTYSSATLGSDLVAGNNDITGLEAITFTSAATWTSLAPSRVSISGTHTYNFANALISPLVNFGGTHIIDQSSSVLGSGTVISAAGTVTNASGETTTFDFLPSFNSGMNFQANGGAVTQTRNFDFNSNPSYTRINSGALTCTELNHFYAAGISSAGTTVTSRHGFRAVNFANLGTLTSQAGITIDSLTAASTGNTHILFGTSTIPAGTFGIYQGNTAANSLNADLTLRTGNLTLTSGNAVLTLGNLTLTDGNINIASGNIRFDSTADLSMAIEGASFAGIGALLLRPNHLNTTEKFSLLSQSNALVLRWTPETAASGGTVSLLNDVKTSASTTGFVIQANSTATPMTSGNIIEFKSGDASNAIKAAISYKGLPGFFGVTAPTAQTTAAGRVAIGAAGATAANRSTTYTGDTGSTAYTVGDLVRALKDYGLIAV